MAVINHVHLSELEDEVRFDSQYYMPENMLFEEEIKAFPTIYLGTVALITDGQHGYFKLDENSEIRQITAKCIKEGLVDKTNADRLSHITHNNNLRSSLTVNDVLVTTAGTIGQIGFVTEEILPANIDQDIGRIAIKNSDVSPHFIWAFLQSKFGRFQIERFTTGQVQTHLSLKKMKKLRIPLLSNHAEIEEIVKRFIESKAAAKESYTQAQKLLESELGLDKLKFKKPVGYTARFSELEQSRRLDAQHFQPRFEQVISHLSKYDTKRVRDIRFYNRRGVQPVYVDDGTVPVVNSQHIGPQHIDYDGLQKTSEKAFAASPEGHIKPNDLLIYTTGAYIGRTNVYLSGQPALASNHVNILRMNSGIDAAYMALVFQTVIGQFQTQKHLRGSAQAELYPADIDKFFVPLLDSKKQAAIGDLVRNSLEKQQESKRLLEQAKSRVEHLIEEATEEQGGSL